MMISPVSVSQQEFSEVLERLEQWPPTDRWTLTRRLLDGLGAQKRPLPRPPMTLEEIEAMLAADELNPDDDAPTIDELEGILDKGTPPPQPMKNVNAGSKKNGCESTADACPVRYQCHVGLSDAAAAVVR